MSNSESTARIIVNDLHRNGAVKASEATYDKATKIVDAVDALCGLMNSYNSEDELWAEVINQALAHQHRSLQQSFWRLMREVIRRYGITHHDLRNQAAVEWCKRVTDKVDAYLPLV